MAYEKTNWSNNTTPINATNLNKIENELESLDNGVTALNSNVATIEANAKFKKIITVKAIRQNINIPEDWGIVKIPINSNIQVGNKFTISNNAVKIGSGVSKVLVSAHCGAISFLTVGGDKEFTIYKNDNAVADAYNAAGSNWKSADITPLLLEVSQNDLISIRLISGQAGSVEILPSYLTVEVVEET